MSLRLNQDKIEITEVDFLKLFNENSNSQHNKRK